MTESDHFTAVNSHYGRPDLGRVILETLQSQGKDLDALTSDDIAPLTHLTGRPKVATVVLGSLVGLQPGQHVLDLGSGLGGPARTLATEFGCRVTGVDLTEEFVRAAQMLTTRVGLGEHITFQQGDALELPFPDASFDVVWHEQFAMHIAAKDRLYREVRRVLRPRGRLAMREYLAGPVQPIYYPVPWAQDASISFLWPAERVRQLLADTGLTELVWDDFTAAELEVRRGIAAAAESGVPAPLTGARLLRGADFKATQANVARNFAENRLRVVQAVFGVDGQSTQ
jgi:MPBQ/MSBQ methyltransferase